mgnify:CR=1 FL=1
MKNPKEWFLGLFGAVWRGRGNGFPARGFAARMPAFELRNQLAKIFGTHRAKTAGKTGAVFGAVEATAQFRIC